MISIDMRPETHQIEDIILSHGTRGMDRLRGAVPVGYCDRAANLIS
jgi:hypothetical protein